MTNIKSVVEIWLQSDAPMFWHLDDEKEEFHLYTFYKDICYLLKLKKWEVEESTKKIFEEIIALKK